jgi:hypothetical protein
MLEKRQPGESDSPTAMRTKILGSLQFTDNRLKNMASSLKQQGYNVPNLPLVSDGTLMRQTKAQAQGIPGLYNSNPTPQESYKEKSSGSTPFAGQVFIKPR